MKKIIIIISLISINLFASINMCDKLAAHPNDNNAVSIGVDSKDTNISVAMKACKKQFMNFQIILDIYIS